MFVFVYMLCFSVGYLYFVWFLDVYGEIVEPLRFMNFLFLIKKIYS